LASSRIGLIFGLDDLGVGLRLDHVEEPLLEACLPVEALAFMPMAVAIKARLEADDLVVSGRTGAGEQHDERPRRCVSIATIGRSGPLAVADQADLAGVDLGPSLGETRPRTGRPPAKSSVVALAGLPVEPPTPVVHAEHRHALRVSASAITRNGLCS